MPRPTLRHSNNHSNLQQEYMIACTGSHAVHSHPDPLLLDSLTSGILLCDVQVYSVEDLESVANLLRSKTSYAELEGVCISSGELRGPDQKMRRNFGVDVLDPRTTLKTDPISPSKQSRERSSGGKCLSLLRGLRHSLAKGQILSSLEFTGINLSLSELKCLAGGLKDNSVLGSFTLRRVHLGDAGASLVLPSLATTSCVVITLSHCGLTDASRQYLSHIIKAHCCRRDELTWAIGLRGKTPYSPSTVPGTVPSQGVICFDLSRNRLTEQTVTSISHALIHDGWLMGLDLSHNVIRQDGADSLCDMTLSNSSIAAIDLTGNPCLFESKACRRGVEKMQEKLSHRNVHVGGEDRECEFKEEIEEIIFGLRGGIKEIDLALEAAEGFEIEAGVDADAGADDAGAGDDVNLSYDSEGTDNSDDDSEKENNAIDNDSSFVMEGIKGKAIKIATPTKAKGDRSIIRDADVMSPSGLRFADGFVDDDDDNQDGKAANDSFGEQLQSAIDDADKKIHAGKKKKLLKRKKVLKKKKKKKVNSVIANALNSSRADATSPVPLQINQGASSKACKAKGKKQASPNFDLSVPQIPPSPYAATIQSKTIRRQSPNVKASNKANPHTKTMEDFEKVLFGSGR